MTRAVALIRISCLAALLGAAAGCDREAKPAEGQAPRGVPASGQGEAPPAQVARAAPAPADPHGGVAGRDPHAGLGQGGAGDPHAGLDLGGGGDPHAGLGMAGGGDPHAGLGAGDPHAGLGMGGAGDPHAGLAMGGDPHGGAPAQPVDPSQFLKGKIVATAATAAHIKPGAILFLSVKPIEPLSGDIIGSTLAVERLDIKTLPVEFHLSGANAMMPTTTFAGDVVITARIDQDGEARSKQPGDVEGSLKARIPASDLTLTLDTVVK